LRTTINDLWRHNRLALVAMIVAAVLTVGFATRTAVHWIFFPADDLFVTGIEGWMTPNFVARIYHLDRAEVRAVLDLPEQLSHRMTLGDIAAERGQPVAILTEPLRALIEARAEAAE
jgi:hypothetical protein